MLRESNSPPEIATAAAARGESRRARKRKANAPNGT